MSKLLGVLSIAVLGFALSVFVPEAQATQLDFGCNSGTCTGSVAVSGGDYSTSGIGVTNTDATAPPSYSGSAWSLVFDTTAKTISLTNGTLGTLSGFIEAFTVTPGNGDVTLALQVLWNKLPPAVVAFFGGETQALDLTQVLYLGTKTTSGSANSVGLTMFPAPEPASLVLLGSGLLALGVSLRKKLGCSGQV
jgi:uncharacterized membrane protein